MKRNWYTHLAEEFWFCVDLNYLICFAILHFFPVFSVSKGKGVVPSNSGEDDFYDATPGFNSSHSGKKRLRHVVKYATVS